MNIDWKRPDRDKVTGEPVSVGQLCEMVINDGLAADKTEAMKYIRRKVPQESWYQERIMWEIRKRAASEGRKAIVWKAAQGAYSRGGVSDVLALVDGVFIAVEVKRPLFGETSQLQARFIASVMEAGGTGGVAIYTDDLDPIWENAKTIWNAHKN